MRRLPTARAVTLVAAAAVATTLAVVTPLLVDLGDTGIWALVQLALIGLFAVRGLRRPDSSLRVRKTLMRTSALLLLLAGVETAVGANVPVRLLEAMAAGALISTLPALLGVARPLQSLALSALLVAGVIVGLVPLLSTEGRLHGLLLLAVSAACFLLARTQLVRGRLVIATASTTQPPVVDLAPTDEGDLIEIPPLLDAQAADDLEELPLFQGVGSEQMEAIRQGSTEHVLRAGEYLFHAGESADALYVIRSGRLAVVQDERVIAELGRGGVLGELALLTGAPRSASVRAVRESTLVRVPAATFQAAADRQMLWSIAAGLAKRIQAISPPAQNRPDDVVISVIALDPSVSAADIAHRLHAHIKRRASAVVLTHFDAATLDRAESQHQKVLIAAESADGNAVDSAFRVGDRIILVLGNPESLHPDLPTSAQGADLVLTFTPTPAFLRALEAQLTPRSVHQVTSTGSSALAPLAARLTGSSLGVVLGGGGARGLAHIGALQELHRAGIRIDRFAGTSMGAIIAGGAAWLGDPDQVDALLYETFVRANPLGDYTLPRYGMLRGARSRAALVRAYGEIRIEELPREFRCVSVDLIKRTAVTHRSGLMADAIGASLRLPGVFSPVPFGDSLHVDGGVLDNLPVGALDRREGPLIAIEVGASSEWHRDDDGKPITPRLGETMVRTLMLAADTATEQARADAALLIRPDTEAGGLLDFDRMDDMVEAGRAATREAMPQIMALLEGPR